ncbi:hypothetical protein Tco_1405277 [Tanacetum coccineum]
MWNSIENGPYKRREILDPKDNRQKILEPVKDLSPEDQKQYYADIKVMNYILRGIPNSIDACKDAQNMWNQIKRLIKGTNISKQERHSMLMNELDKFVIEDGESLTSVYEGKYVTLTRQKFILEKEHYDVLYDYLSQLEPHIKASKAKKAARNHYLLYLVTNSHANPPYSHASPSYSRLPQPYYVTHHSSVIDNDDDYQGKIQGDKLSTAMMLLTRVVI